MDYRDLTRLCVKIAGVLVIVYAATELAQSVQITLNFARKGAPLVGLFGGGLVVSVVFRFSLGLLLDRVSKRGRQPSC